MDVSDFLNIFKKNFNPSIKSLSFHQVFSSLPETTPLIILRDLEARIDEVCWLVCKKAYLERDNAILPEDCVYELFRVFCLLADLVPDHSNPNVYQVTLKYYGNKISIDPTTESFSPETLWSYLAAQYQHP